MLQATASGLQDAFSKLCKSIRLTDTQKVLHECAAMHLLWRRGLLRINEGQLKLPDEYWIYYFMGLKNGAYVVLNSYILLHYIFSWIRLYTYFIGLKECKIDPKFLQFIQSLVMCFI